MRNNLLILGDLPPLTVYDKDSIKLVIHFAQNKPREDVYVMVISITSSKPQPVKSVIFQAAVPKVDIYFHVQFRG